MVVLSSPPEIVDIETRSILKTQSINTQNLRFISSYSTTFCFVLFYFFLLLDFFFFALWLRNRHSQDSVVPRMVRTTKSESQKALSSSSRQNRAKCADSRARLSPRRCTLRSLSIPVTPGNSQDVTVSSLLIFSPSSCRKRPLGHKQEE